MLCNSTRRQFEYHHTIMQPGNGVGIFSENTMILCILTVIRIIQDLDTKLAIVFYHLRVLNAKAKAETPTSF